MVASREEMTGEKDKPAKYLTTILGESGKIRVWEHFIRKPYSQECSTHSLTAYDD